MSDVTLTIDGTEVTVPAGLNIIEAASHAGSEVPHYCYHPRLSVVGNCRICLVEVEGWPVLQIGCNTRVSDGMVVHTGNDRVSAAREGVMELLLINHPLDCTICDQAGECKLQEYAVDHGSGITRFEYDKVKKPKNVSWGDKVVFDSERCILCTRCVRFLDEVAGTDEVSIDMRGDKCTLIVQGDGKLTSPYQMNVIDLCPVGALTSRDFRFKSRLWFMNFTNSICTSCARGCNVVVGSRDDSVLRMVPRFNPEVNDHWMCDWGRLNFGFVNREDRLAMPQVGGKSAPYPVAIEAAAAILKDAKSVAAVASPFMTNEELFGLKGLLDHLGVEDRWFLRPTGEGDDLLLHPDRAPNARGAELAGFAEAPEGWPDGVDWDALLWFVPRVGEELLPDEVQKRARSRIVFSLDARDGDVCFPLTTWIEKDGTMLSAGDMVQRIAKGTTYQPTMLTERLVLDRIRSTLDEEYGGADTAAQAFARLAGDGGPFAGLSWGAVGLGGARLQPQEASA